MPIRTGIDVTSIDRIDQLLAEYGTHFKRRFFNLAEIDYCEARKRSAQSYAGIWAAKEATFKVLGRGKRWHDITIKHESNGRHIIDVSPELLKLPVHSIPPTASWDCSISHDAGVAIASAVCCWT